MKTKIKKTEFQGGFSFFDYIKYSKSLAAVG